MNSGCVYSTDNLGNCVGDCNSCQDYCNYEREININISPHLLFKDEIDLIKSQIVKFIVNHTLRVVPAYFYVIPASSTGKYHPKTSLGIQGLLRHVKAAVKVFVEISGNKVFGGFNEYELDIGIAALILHDSVKCGFECSDYTVFEHPELVSQLVSDWNDGELNEVWKDIIDLIKTHHGQWNTNKRDPKSKSLEVPQTPLQKLVHLSDFISSRRCIEIDTSYSESDAAPYKKDVNKPATQAQLDYLYSLINKVKHRGLQVPKEVLDYDFSKATIVEVSKMINSCKELLNGGD